jgi:hypothetical protein
MDYACPMSDQPQPYQPLSLLSIRLGPLSLRAWVFLALCALFGLMYYKQLPPDISNAEYVQTLLDKGTLKRTAGAIIRDARPKATFQNKAEADADEAKWKGIATNLADCMEKQARDYLASDDPFMKKHFERSTPQVISTRLLTACNGMQYLPKPKEGN